MAVTELALALPILVLLVAGTFEACSMIYLQQTLSVAAYEGARVALIPKTTTADVERQVELILDGRRVEGFSISVTPDVESALAGTFIAVTATAPYGDNSMLGGWFYSDRTLSCTVEMMKEFD